MNQFKKLLKNTYLLGLGNLITKIAQYFIVAISTYKLSTYDYGIADIIIQTANFLLPIVSMDMASAVFRFSMDSNENKSLIITNSFFLITTGIITTSVLAFCSYNIISSNFQYFYILVVVLMQSYQSVLKEYIRGLGELTQYIIGGVINAIVQCSCCFIFFYLLDLKVSGIIYTVALGNLSEILYLLFNKNIYSEFDFRNLSVKYMRRLLSYTLPLVPNTAMWWIVSASDRYFLLYIEGAAATGIYAVAHKIPAILTILTGLFLQSWQISAIENKDANNRISFYSKVFENLYLVLVFSTIFVLVLIKPLVQIFVSKDFYSAWLYAPLLVVIAALGSIQSFFGVNYTVTKNTLGSLKSTVLMAIINLIFNYLLIPKMGIIGAGLATLIAYIFVIIYRYFDTRMAMPIIIDKFKIVASFTLLIACSLVTIYAIEFYYILIAVTFVIEIIMNHNVIKNMIKKHIRR